MDTAIVTAPTGVALDTRGAAEQMQLTRCHMAYSVRENASAATVQLLTISQKQHRACGRQVWAAPATALVMWLPNAALTPACTANAIPPNTVSTMPRGTCQADIGAAAAVLTN
jgi:hypothetical protein